MTLYLIERTELNLGNGQFESCVVRADDPDAALRLITHGIGYDGVKADASNLKITGIPADGDTGVIVESRTSDF